MSRAIEGVVATLLPLLIWLLQLGGAVAVIVAWRRFRPADPVSWLSVLGPPLIVLGWATGLGACATAVRLVPPLLGGSLSGDTALAVLLGLAVGSVAGAWSGAANYVVVGAGASLFRRVRADAPWLLPSVGLAAVGVAIGAAIGMAFLLYGVSAMGSFGETTLHGD